MSKSLLALAIGIVLAVLIGCGDDPTAPPPAETPINSLKLHQYGPDSLRVTFDTTIGYQRAELRVQRPGGTFIEVDEISGSAPRVFRIKWVDWFHPDQGGYVMVRIYYGLNEESQYAWSKRFIPK